MGPPRSDLLEHLQGPLVPRPVARRLGDTAPLAPRPVLGPGPGPGEPDIDQGVLAGRGVGPEDADLAMVDLAEPTPPWPRHADRGIARLGEPRGVEDDHAVGGADLAAHLAGPLADPGAVVPGGGADDVRQAVAIRVVAVGDRLGVLVPQVGDQAGQVGPGVVRLLPAHPALGEGPGELGEALDAALEDFRGDLAFVEQRRLAEPVTPGHRPPPVRLVLAGRLFDITPWPLSTEFRQPKYDIRSQGRLPALPDSCSVWSDPRGRG